MSYSKLHPCLTLKEIKMRVSTRVKVGAKITLRVHPVESLRSNLRTLRVTLKKIPRIPPRAQVLPESLKITSCPKTTPTLPRESIKTKPSD